MASATETASYQSWRCGLDDRWASGDYDRVGCHSGPGASSGSDLPAVSLIPGPKSRLEGVGIRSMDASICYQHPGRGTVLARLCPTTSGDSLRTRSGARKRGPMVLFVTGRAKSQLADLQ